MGCYVNIFKYICSMFILCSSFLNEYLLYYKEKLNPIFSQTIYALGFNQNIPNVLIWHKKANSAIGKQSYTLQWP